MAMRGVKNVCVQMYEEDHQLFKDIAKESGLTQGELLHAFLRLANFVTQPKFIAMSRVERLILFVMFNAGNELNADAASWAIENNIGKPQQRIAAVLGESDGPNWDFFRQP